MRRTFHDQYADILEKVHALAGCCAKELPYLGMYITQLVAGQGLNRHQDYRIHEKYLNYTINFGRCERGHFEMLRGEELQSCAVPLVWTEFTADILEHRVREATSGERFSVTLFTPSHLGRLSESDWVNFDESYGFPVHLYSETEILEGQEDAGKDCTQGNVAAETQCSVQKIEKKKPPTPEPIAEEVVESRDDLEDEPLEANPSEPVSAQQRD